MSDGLGCSLLHKISDVRQSRGSPSFPGVLFSRGVVERECLRPAPSADNGGVAAAAEPAPTGSTRHIRVSRRFVCLPLARSGRNRWIHRSERTAYHLQCWSENV